MNNTTLYNLFVYCCIGAAVMIAVAVISAVFKIKRKKAPAAIPENIDLMKYPKNKIAKPIVPNLFSVIGIICFAFVFSLSGLFFLKSELPVFASVVISGCFGLAVEVAISNLKYAYDVKNNPDIIFVPRTAGYTGKVVKDIPAGKRGEGLIRIIYNDKVCEIRALTMDEVTLAAGTQISVMYAYSDCTVMVERK